MNPDAPGPREGSDALLPRSARVAAAWSLVVLLVVTVAAGLVALVVVLRAVTAPLAIAVLGSALVCPLFRRLVAWSLPRAWAAGLTCVALVVLVFGVGWVLTRLVTDNAAKIGDALTTAATRLREELGASGDPAAGTADGLHELGGRLGRAIADGVVSGVGLALELVTGAVLVLALTFFLLRDGHRVPGVVRSLAPARHRDLAERIVRRAFLAVTGFMRGTTIIAFIDAVFIAIGLLILGVPGAPGLAALVFVGAYVPYVGAFLAGTVAVLVAFADGGPALALWALGVVLAVQLIEGVFLQPGIQSHTVALHPAVVMGAVVAGGAIAGILGALFAVPVVAIAVSVVAELRRYGGPDAPADIPPAAPAPGPSGPP